MSPAPAASLAALQARLIAVGVEGDRERSLMSECFNVLAESAQRLRDMEPVKTIMAARTPTPQEVANAFAGELEHHLATFQRFSVAYVAHRMNLMQIRSESLTLQERIRELGLQQQGKQPAPEGSRRQ